MPTAIYTRVSTEEQAKHGYSLESQLEACRKYARNRQMIVKAEFSDDMSGAKLNRPGLDQLRDLAEAGELTDVIVYSTDRLSRSLAHSLILRDEWQMKGITLHTVEAGALEDTAEGRLSENVHAVIAEYEREKIKERTRRGIIQKAKRGKMPLTGHVQYGYIKIGRGKEAILKRDEAKLAAIKKMFELYVHGDDGTGLSLYEVAYRMSDSGVPSPSGLEWSYGMVARLLETDIYHGVSYYGKSRVVNGKRLKRPQSEWIRIDVPELACVSEELFSAAKERKQKNRERAKRNRKRNYLLSNQFKCAGCGRLIVGRYHKHSDSSHYRCAANWIKGKGPNCPQRARSIAVHIADNLVWGWVESIITDEDYLRAGLEAMAARKEGKEQEYSKELKGVKNALAKTEKRITRLIDRMVDCDEVVLPEIKAKLNEAGRRKKALQSEKERLGAYLEQLTVSDDLVEKIGQQMEAVRDLLPGITFEKKRTILDLLNIRVVFRADGKLRQLEVHCDLPGKDGVIDLCSSTGTYESPAFKHTE